MVRTFKANTINVVIGPFVKKIVMEFDFNIKIDQN